MTDSVPPRPPHLPVKTIRADLRGRRGLGGWSLWWALCVALGLTACLIATFGWKLYFADLPPIPPPQQLWSTNRSPGMIFLDRYGNTIASRGPRNGARVALDDMPPYLPAAFLAAEDRRFFQHGPVDPLGVIRALRANLYAGTVVEGGSTLTQQLAKTIFLTPDQTFKRKIQEAIMARRLEGAIGKKGVLELYLNRVYFGANAFGVGAAAQTYFGKPAQTLSLSEAAMLAALPKAPSRLAPTRDMAAALARQRLVLDRMRQQGWVTAAQEAFALAHPPVLAPPGPGEGDYGYALDLAALQADQIAGADAPDLIVQTTIDPALQAGANQAVRQVMADAGARAGAEQAALVALGPDGSVRALVGGLDHGDSPFNRAVQARRQPGSAFKPFIYAAALDAGVRPEDIRQDAPLRLGPWSPQNYGGRYHGAMTVQDAFAHSVNTVAVRLAQEAGVERIGELARRFGFTTIPTRPGLSVALGAYEVSLLELSGAFQVFQQGGRRFPPAVVQAISTSGGRILYERTPSQALQVYDPGRARLMVRMMRAVIDSGTGRRAAFGRPAAGKTGTTQDWRDAWFVGFTPDWIAGVWVGNDDNRPMNKVTGGDLPADIWRRFMILAHSGLPPHDFEPAAAMQSADLSVKADREATADERAALYSDLADAFAQAAQPQEPPVQ